MNRLAHAPEDRWRVIRMNLLARSALPGRRRLLRDKVNHCWDLVQRNRAGEQGADGPPVTRAS